MFNKNQTKFISRAISDEFFHCLYFNNLLVTKRPINNKIAGNIMISIRTLKFINLFFFIP